MSKGKGGGGIWLTFRGSLCVGIGTHVDGKLFGAVVSASLTRLSKTLSTISFSERSSEAKYEIPSKYSFKTHTLQGIMLGGIVSNLGGPLRASLSSATTS